MFDFSSLLTLVPKSVSLTILGILIGGSAVLGAEARYMKVSDFTKSYILTLKREIRENSNELKNAETEKERALIREILEGLLDDLCQRVDDPKDEPYCKNRSVAT